MHANSKKSSYKANMACHFLKGDICGFVVQENSECINFIFLHDVEKLELNILFSPLTNVFFLIFFTKKFNLKS